MKILIVGAGAWGTALGISAAARNEVRLWARDPVQAQAMGRARLNAQYLPEVRWPAGLHATAAPFEAEVHWADLVVVATPMAALRDCMLRLAPLGRPVAWLCKGFEAPQGEQAGLLGHEIRAQLAPGLRAGVLSGPSFALEVARSQPTALVAASDDPELCQQLVGAFHTDSLRIYANDDIVGVEVGGAVKNVLAIATGLCDGLGLGLNARAALITRGLAEITRLGIALGAKPETFMGLSGLGDLVLTATGDLSRNRKVGLLLAQGQTAAQAVASLGHVAEGVYTARTVAARAQQLGVDMPIARAVVRLLDGHSSPREAVSALMGREPRRE